MELYQIKTEHPVVGYCESRIGGRSENQDSYGYHDTPFGLLIVVCDGMGGGPAGKTASSLAVSEILAGVMECEHDTSPKDVLEKAIQRANHALLDAIAENPELTGMGTTCTALLLNEQSAIMAHVGDSRIYQLRQHGKVFRTFDHSLVFDLVKQKVITEEQARLSDQSNIITRAIGMKHELEIDIEERPYKKGDRFLLCTDGIHGTMPEKELMALATQRGELGNVVDGIAAMVDGNGKKNGGGHDNLTLVIVETKEKSELKEKRNNKTTIVLAIIAAVLAAVCLLLNGCKNKDIDVDAFSIEREDVRPGFDTVYIEGTYGFFDEAEAMKLNIGKDSTLSDASSHAVALTGKDYAVTVRNLQPATTYYYRYSVNVGQPRDFLTPMKKFNTPLRPPRQFSVKVSAQPEAGGRVTGTGVYQENQQCSVSATANVGYAFVNWTENGEIVSMDAVYSFKVTGNRELESNFCYSGGGNSIPDGIIEGKFSVSATQKVYFSQGNLQYKPSTNTWRFAENQYDCIGIANNNISQYYNDWIDLFGWGTSGFPHGATCYLPYSTSQRYYDYYVYGYNSYNLYDQTGMGDWGANLISNGGNQTCIWRTLSKSEWVYLLQTRNTSSGLRYAKARVAGKNGVILLPDNWNISTYTLQNANSNNASFDSNVISSSDWIILQSACAIFLPAAGSRAGISVSGTGASGYYWSSSCYDDYYACMLSFSNTTLTPYQNDYRYYGQSVRVVYEIIE